MKTECERVGNVFRLKWFSQDKDAWFKIKDEIKQIKGWVYRSGSKLWTVPANDETRRILQQLGFDLKNDEEQEKLIIEKDRNKLKKIQNEIETYNFDCDILYDYQKQHAKQLLYGLNHTGAVIDASDTGVGKTFVALSIAKFLKLKPIVLTPLSVISSWKKIAELFDLAIYVNNYEQFKFNNTPYVYIEKVIIEIDKKTGEPIYEHEITWNVAEDSLLIFDEIHRTKDHKTINANMLISSMKSNCKKMGLSATIADNPLHLYATGHILKLFKSVNGYWKWAFDHGVSKGFYGMQFSGEASDLQKIHNEIFPAKGGRIAIKDLGDKFPDNLIITDTYNMGDRTKEIQEMYVELERLKEKEEHDKESELVEILRMRQRIELLKVPTFIELTKDAIEEGSSVVIFVNFRETINALSKRLKTKCIIDGAYIGEDRERNINAFQEDKERVIICNIKAGGVGISLHDMNGKYNRISLISPTYSAIDLIQVFGRIHRNGAKSKAIQKIILCAGTKEEEIAEKVSKKINNIKVINDGDLV
jgi:superfamily II DNA or RNA helicase